MQDWEKIYETEGDVIEKKDVPFYPLVMENIQFLKENNVKKILDLGCGAGRHSIPLAEAGFEVTGVDIAPKALKLLNTKKQDLPIKTIEAEMDELPFVDETFDAIVCINVIHHAKLEKIKKTISEMHRVLKKGGFILLDILSTSNFRTGKPDAKEIEPNTYINVGHIYKEWDVPHHFSPKEEVLELFSKFEIIKMEEMDVEPPKQNIRWDLVLRKSA